MNTPAQQPSGPEPEGGHESEGPEVEDRVYRSTSGIAGGVLLLAIIGWLCVDAVVTGEGRAPWLALATLLAIVPPVVAYTLLPAVYAGDDRLRVRNPFRTIVLPWGRVAALRAGYTNEVVSDAGTKYQLWALPVSLRARKRAARREMRATGERAQGVDVRTAGQAPGAGGASRRGGAASAPGGTEAPERAPSDRAMDELRELHENRQTAGSAQGEVSVRWSYEILAPTLAGVILLTVLLAVT
ncbi:PH domain-containing protein [Streptomyces sp. NPDC058442]|uniref:PH domain-containing protein n=1 Tax=Streptomyces sp. NPDC058442 TaxID=3346503 RepID=UPI00364AE7C7